MYILDIILFFKYIYIYICVKGCICIYIHSPVGHSQNVLVSQPNLIPDSVYFYKTDHIRKNVLIIDKYLVYYLANSHTENNSIDVKVKESSLNLSRKQAYKPTNRKGTNLMASAKTPTKQALFEN